MRKSTPESLAVLGGPPAFTSPRMVGRPNIGDREQLRRRFDQILDARWLTNNGAMVQEFERRIAAAAGTKHALAVTNATVGLELLLRALDVQGEVIVPSFTFVATAHAVAWTGGTPVFADIDAATHTLDPAAVERVITPRTRALLAVHLWGHPCHPALKDLAERHGLVLMYDAAHAFGCAADGVPVGRGGRAEVFSFHATKFVNSGEGGAIVTDDDALADRLRLARNFGFAGVDHVVALGTNAKMNEFNAAMGLGSLDAMPAIVAHNERMDAAYRRELAGVPHVSVLAPPPGVTTNRQYVVLDVFDPAQPDLRDLVLAALQAEQVLARRYFWPGVHRFAPYRDRPEVPHLPVTERVSSGILVLPTGTAVDEEDVATIASILRTAVTHAPRLRARSP